MAMTGVDVVTSKPRVLKSNENGDLERRYFCSIAVKIAVKRISHRGYSIGQRTLFQPESGGPVRSRKINAAPDNRSFQTPRANIPTVSDNLKPKPIPESKAWSHDAKLSNVESKPVQAKKLVQKPKILNKEINQSQKLATKQELKRIAQKYPGALEKLVIQKKKILAAKAKAASEIAGEIPAPNNNKITKVTNVSIQKAKPQEKQPAIQKTKLENDTSTLKNKAQDNASNTISIINTNTPIINAKDNITPAQDIKPEGNVAKQKNPASEIAAKTNPIQEKKPQDTQTTDKAGPVLNCVGKESEEESKTEKCSKQQVELDPILARAVDEEIQDIMIQVWKELPDDPILEEDRFAVEKLRNEAGDDLRRVLGLNITKRLLNVYNNLFVKMQFKCRPQMGCLTSFLNEYNIKKFKRIDTNSNTFAAQMENIEDFDRLCAQKDVMCGEAKVTITPCYKFTDCPTSLKTIYDDTYFYEATVQENTKTSKSINTQNAQVIASNENVVKPATNKDLTEAKSDEKTVTLEIQDTANLNHEVAKCSKTDSKNTDASKNDKTDGTETLKSTDSVCNDSKGVKNDTTNEKQKGNDSLKTKTDSVKSKENEYIENITNEEELNKDTLKDKAISDYIIKDIIETDDDLDEVPECQMEGDEELDDEDILALMSEGVVLDECSGSDDDK